MKGMLVPYATPCPLHGHYDTNHHAVPNSFAKSVEPGNLNSLCNCFDLQTERQREGMLLRNC